MGSPGSLIKRGAAGFGLLFGQVMHAAHRKDLPSHQNQDPSGDFGPSDHPRLRIALLGDSSVTAPGVDDLDLSWARRVAHALSDRYRVELRSVAIGGSKIADVLRDQLEPAVALEPDMALVSVGANDALRAVPVAAYERDLDELLRRLTATIPAVGISGVGDLGTLPRLPTLARGWARVRGRAIDRAIARVAHRYGVEKSHVWGPEWQPFRDGDPRMFAPDRFHASEEGHAIFAQSIMPVVEALLRRLESGLIDRPGSRESST